MNHKKICFITCVNDYEMYEESLKYVHNLSIPEEFEIETLAIKDAKSITSGYNEAMKNSDAKYKVYLHQDVFIINKNFIFDVLDIFKSDDNIGLLGVAGANTIPTNAVWWDSTHRFGKVYENHSGNMKLLAFDDVEENYQEVKALDGMIMVTQYDVQWREDIFTGWHFYDLSQCVEFSLKGYKVAVARQGEPWCIHDCGFVETTGEYDNYKEVFLDEYSKKIFPLVSILITTHNRPHFFRLALESAINQTYKNIEVVVSDDSDDEITKELIKPYLERYSNIKYYLKKGMTHLENCEKCMELATGEYGNWLTDDDLLDIKKIDLMMNYYLEYGDEISFVTSYRKLINSNGDFLKDYRSNIRIFDKDTIIEGVELGKIVLPYMNNIIGEITTVLLRINDLKNMYKRDNDIKILGLADVATWLELLNSRKVVYIASPLSYFRIHDQQAQEDLNVQLACISDWGKLMRYYFNKNLYFENEELFFSSIKDWLMMTVKTMNNIKITDLINKEYANELNNEILEVNRILFKIR